MFYPRFKALLSLILLCAPLATHAQIESISSGFGTIKVDGIKQSGEWAMAGRLVFDAVMDSREANRKAFAILYVMNDDNHLFLGLVTEAGLLDAGWLRFSLKTGSETTQYYLNRQGNELLSEVSGASGNQRFELPDCCQAKLGTSQGYDMLEFSYSQAQTHSNSAWPLLPGMQVKLQLSLISCPELPGEGDCWVTADDAFGTDTGNFEINIKIAANPKAP